MNKEDNVIIEYYRDQNLDALRQNVINIYETFCSDLFPELKFDYTNWHPEQYEQFNDTWKLIKMMERMGYHSYYNDSVLYTSKFRSYDGLADKIFSGDGLSFNQAVCNCFVNYGSQYKSE